jgi:hypothetical protein
VACVNLALYQSDPIHDEATFPSARATSSATGPTFITARFNSSALTPNFSDQYRHS